MRSRVVRALRWPVAIAILAVAAWLLRDLDFAALASTLRQAEWPLLVVAAVLNLSLNIGARTLRWRALLPPSPRTGRPVAFLGLASILATSQAMNVVLPFRAGEAVRTVALTDREGFSVRDAVAAQVVEKLVELASLVTVAVPIVLSSGASRAFVGRWLLLLGLLAGALALLFVLRRATGSIQVVGHPRKLLRSYAWALLSDGVDLATIGLSLAAVHVTTSPIAWCVVFVAVNLAIALPSTPGQVGVLEAGAVFALVGLGVERDRALAFALLYHGVHVVPFTLAGGLALATSAYRDRRRRTALP